MFCLVEELQGYLLGKGGEEVVLYSGNTEIHLVTSSQVAIRIILKQILLCNNFVLAQILGLRCLTVNTLGNSDKVRIKVFRLVKLRF